MAENKVVPGKRLGLKRTPPHLMAKIPKLARYIALPAPPSGPVDVSQGISIWPMFLNNSLGDCTCAAVGHMVEIFGKQSTGAAKMVTDQDVLALYESQGYKPSDPSTDQGADMGSVCSYWKSGKWAPDTILAYAQVDPSDAALMKTALWLFSGLYLGVALPLTAESQGTWDVVAADPSQNAPGSWGGHAINAIEIDDGGITVVTWGATKRMTWAFWNTYGMEAFAVVPADYDQLGGKPVDAVGFDEQQLLADMAELND